VATLGRPAAPGRTEDSLSERNRRTAATLVAWILALAAASVLVAWLRN
jgi:hypothetical protein